MYRLNTINIIQKQSFIKVKQTPAVRDMSWSYRIRGRYTREAQKVFFQRHIKN